MKKILLIAMLIGTTVLIISTYTVQIGICTRLDYGCRYFFDALEQIGYFFPIVLVFSILTYKSDAIFRYWFAFAKYGIPITLLLITAINVGVLNSPTQGSFGWGGIINNVIDFWVSVTIYAVFVVGSLIQIGRGYYRKD